MEGIALKFQYKKLLHLNVYQTMNKTDGLVVGGWHEWMNEWIEKRSSSLFSSFRAWKLSKIIKEMPLESTNK